MKLAVFVTIVTIVTILIITLVYIKKHESNNVDGVIIIDKTDLETDTYKLQLNISFDELDLRDKVIFGVVKK